LPALPQSCLGSALILLQIGAADSIGRAAAIPQPNAASPLFEEIAPQHSGLEFAHRLDPEHALAYLYESGYACGGVAVGDVNGDDRPDIVLISGPDDNALFLNRGSLLFEKAAASKDLADAGHWAVSPAMVDVDNDGDLDLFVANYDWKNRLWLNDGHGHFKECAAVAGLD
jgi:enediyne biosynthesis protein E4